MNLFDWMFVAAVILCVVFGFAKGTRASLSLAVVFLAAMLAGAVFIGALERLILDLSGIGSENYPDAPGVAVLILHDRVSLAYLAALLPSIFTLFFAGALAIGSILFKGLIPPPSLSAASRAGGAAAGVLNGALAGLLAAVQFTRLPWPPATRVFGSSLLISVVNHASNFLIPSLAGTP